MLTHQIQNGGKHSKYLTLFVHTGRLTFFARCETVAVALAAAVVEWMATACPRVVEESRDDFVTRTTVASLLTNVCGFTNRIISDNVSCIQNTVLTNSPVFAALSLTLLL